MIEMTKAASTVRCRRKLDYSSEASIPKQNRKDFYETTSFINEDISNSVEVENTKTSMGSLLKGKKLIKII